MSRFYVYALVDPNKCAPFYIGKGSQLRTEQHFIVADKKHLIIGTRTEDIVAEDSINDTIELTQKQIKIISLREQGKTHADIARIIMQDLDELTAFDVESMLITFCYPRHPTPEGILNIQGGVHAERFRSFENGKYSNWPRLANFDLFDNQGNRLTVSENLYYVYALIDPETNDPFYIGKGKGNRIFSHFDDARYRRDNILNESEKLEKIRGILENSSECDVGRIVARGVSEASAFAIEALLIRFYYGFDILTNQVEGQRGYRVRPKPNLDWECLCGFDHPKVIDPNSPNDREWIRKLLMADGIHKPIEDVCRSLPCISFDDVRILDAGGLAKEGDVVVDGRAVTRLKVFVRRKRIQIEARPRNREQFIWMKNRFDTLGVPKALRRDAVFIPSIWRGAKNMTLDVDEAVKRAMVFLEILKSPIDAEMLTKYHQFLNQAIMDVNESHDIPILTENSTEDCESEPSLELQVVKPKTDPARQRIDAIERDYTPCLCHDRLIEIAEYFEELDFLGPFNVDNEARRIYIKSLCDMGQGSIWLRVYCGSRGFQAELRAESISQEQLITNHFDNLNIQIGRDDFVFKFQNAKVTNTIELIIERIIFLLQVASAGDRDQLDGIPPEYFLFN